MTPFHFNYRLILLSMLTVLLMAGCQPASEPTTENPDEAGSAPIALVIHGGAGTITPESMTPEKEAEIRADLEAALQAGYALLESGASSLDAIVAAINILEDAPAFNAGRGAVLNYEGVVELDASIMDGATLMAGAIAGASTLDGGLRYPIQAARAVMEQSPHVMLSGAGAEEFAAAQGLEFVETEWFLTDRRMEQLERLQSSGLMRETSPWFSTVGAVALDQMGHLAAGTSTGGMTNKRWGRIGDSPIIGAGTYANDESCAVSATGHGEFFIRHVVAYDICARVQYLGANVVEAADEVVNGVLVEAGALGGVIAMDPQGNIAMPFNTPGMYRGAIDVNGQMTIGIYGIGND